MRRRRVQPKTKSKPRQPRARRSRVQKPPVSFSEMLLNWVIVGLAAVVLVFLVSFIWRLVAPKKKDVPIVEKPAQEQVTLITQNIRVEVLNGCGVSGIAKQFAYFLRDQGFDVVNTDNYRNFNVDSSFVLDRRSMDMMFGKKIATVLGISKTLVKPLLNSDLNLEATVVLGKDYRFLRGFKGQGHGGD